jgi:phosphinothricin acetyltransferase
VPPDTLVGRAVTVRDASLADLPRITTIWNHEVLWTDATTDTEPRNEGTAREWFEHHPASYPIVVAATGDVVLAFGALSPYRPKPAFARTVEDSVYVERRHRRAGLGGLILAELIRRARALGHHSMLARVASANEASVRLHARHGFRVVGVEQEVAWKHDRWLDVTVMQRPL